MKTLAGPLIVASILVSSGASMAFAQSGDWAEVRALRAGQKVWVVASHRGAVAEPLLPSRQESQTNVRGEEVRGRFESASETLLVVSRGSRIVYLARPDVRQVAIRPEKAHKALRLGIWIGVPWGIFLGVFEGSWPAVPVTIAMFAGIGAVVDSFNTGDKGVRLVTVYSTSPPRKDQSDANDSHGLLRPADSR
jgi:hypothetical protein